MNIAIGSDHRGFELKKMVMKLLEEKGHSYKDFGTYTEEPVDYPDVAKEVSNAVVKGDFDRGILICATGIGMCIAANKINGVLAALCYDTYCATMARQHNNANILCLSGRMKMKEVSEIVNAFLSTDFEGGRHLRRVNKIKAME